MASRPRKVATVTAVVVMVALVGCVGGMTDSGTLTERPSNNSSQTVTSTPAPTPTPTPTPPTSDELNVTESRNETQSSLTSAGSYTLNFAQNTTTSFPDGTQIIVVNTTSLIDLEDDQTLSNTTFSGTSISGQSGETETTYYITGDISYSRVINQTSTQYYAQDFSNTSVTPSQSANGVQNVDSLSSLAWFDEWEEQELTTFDNSTVRRYQATELDSPPTIQGDILNWSAEFYIDSEGMIRSFNIAYSQQYPNSNVTSGVSIHLTITDINSSSVEEPPWISEAPEPQPVEVETSTELDG